MAKALAFIAQAVFYPQVTDIANEKLSMVRCQFHQFFTGRFFVRTFRANYFLYLHFWFELFFAQTYFRKCAQKMLVKLTIRDSIVSYKQRTYFRIRKSCGFEETFILT
jgi:hypothetical protein